MKLKKWAKKVKIFCVYSLITASVVVAFFIAYAMRTVFSENATEQIYMSLLKEVLSVGAVYAVFAIAVNVICENYLIEKLEEK